MTLNELKYIVAVAREGHFSKAAEACFVSQPTLSVAVKKLEDELGLNIFERGTGSVTLTPTGRSIVEQAQRVLEEAGAIRLLATQGRDQLVGPLKLGAIHTVGPYLFPHLLPAVSQHAARMPLVIRENFTSVLSEQLKRGEQDVIVISLPFDEPGINTKQLYDEPFVVLLPAKHPLAGEVSISVEQLSQENVLLLGEGHCFRDQVLEICPDCAQREGDREAFQYNLEGCSLETIRCMVASGVGITILPLTAVEQRLIPNKLLVVRPLAGDLASRRIALAWRKSFPRLEAVELLGDVIKQIAGSGVRRVDE